jgi:hypothetical protein
MHFYHNLIFVVKGQNEEGSTTLINNTTDAAWVLNDYTCSSSYVTGRADVPHVMIPPVQHAS